MKVYIVSAVIFIIALILFSIIGIYSGGALYLYLMNDDVSFVTYKTLYTALHLPFRSAGFANAIWSACLTVWIALLPVFVLIVFLFMHFMKRKESLYGNARFANNKELEPFHYTGDYR